MGAARACTLGSIAVLIASCLLGPTPALALEPGVHIDPGSPAAKEYALPLNQARATGETPSSQEGSAPFGTGIKPPGSGHGPSGKAGGPAPGSTGAGSQPAPTLPADVVAAVHGHAGGGGGSLLALIGGGVMILVLGGFGGVVLRHNRHPRPTP